MAKVINYYKIPTGITKEICDSIVKSFDNEDLYDSGVFGPDQKDSNTINDNIRKSKNLWISTDHWISGMMAHFINCANQNLFNYDLVNWSDKIQYTVYEGKGSHYAWHTDTALSPFDNFLMRKLSISLLLSSKSDYEGGEFQIMYGPRHMDTIELDIGDAIIFPSDAAHRVRPLKSGKRISLVGWYSGPKFK